METAIVPSVTKTFRKIVEEKPVEKVKDDLLKQVQALEAYPAWKAMQEIIDEIIATYDNIDIDPSETPEQIGFRYMVSRVLKEELTIIRNLPVNLGKLK